MQNTTEREVQLDEIREADTALAAIEQCTDDEIRALTYDEARNLRSVVDGEWCYLESCIKPEIFDSPVDPLQAAELAAYNDRIERCRMASSRLERLATKRAGNEVTY